MARLKRPIKLLIVAILIASSVIFSQPESVHGMTGSGTVGDPYIIYDVTDLQNVSLDLTAYYELNNNIDASATVGWNGGLGFDPLGDLITPFTGNFDGKGFVITDLVVNRPAEQYCGLFGRVTSILTIEDVGLENVSITGTGYDGGLIGAVTSAITISQCYTTGSVSGTTWVGGLIGSGAGTTDNCYSRATATASAGITGGLVGINTGALDDCYSTGLVTAPASTGGLVGVNSGGSATNCFWDTQTSGQATSPVGTGKTTAEMKTATTFTDAGWDFVNIWDMENFINDGYPFLGGATTLTLWYQPISYIVGTTLPDREGVAQDGTITWGVNPAGVVVTMGSLTAYVDETLDTGRLETPDVAGDVVGVTDMYQTDTAMENRDNLFYFFVSDMSEQTDTPVLFFWWLLVGIFIVLGITAAARYFPHSVWIIGLAGIMVIGAAIAITFLPGWILIIAVIVVVGLALIDRTPAV